MATELALRLEKLINEAGSRAKFMQRVWGDIDLHKGKLSKWLDGGGMRRGEAEKIAKAFSRRPAWLLLGEEPERVDATRSIPALADELRNEVLTRALAGKDYDQEFRDWMKELISGEDLLNRLTEMVAQDAELLDDWFRQKLALREQIKSLKGLRQYGKIRDVVYLLLELDEKLHAPRGEVIGRKRNTKP